MTSEIGSEFHRMSFESGRGLTLPRPGTLVFSGRTAIEAVLKKLPDARTAMLPSYCCDSMIVPFRAAGIEVTFFDVFWDNRLEIDIEGKADILFWCSYFGYRNDMPDFDGVIIEDITHSFMSAGQFHERSDYLVASLRKWEPVNCGGYCSVDIVNQAPPEGFVERKTAAMRMKAEYLEALDGADKQQFLKLFGESNQWLAEHYSGLSIDMWSRDYIFNVDMESQRERRRNNAMALYEGLRGRVRFLFPEEDMECPLFVPILLENRDKVRSYLTSNRIYCPVHWPKPEGCESNIYNLELSLICDQRYGIEDMERMVSVLLEVI